MSNANEETTSPKRSPKKLPKKKAVAEQDAKADAVGTQVVLHVGPLERPGKKRTVIAQFGNDDSFRHDINVNSATDRGKYLDLLNARHTLAASERTLLEAKMTRLSDEIDAIGPEANVGDSSLVHLAFEVAGGVELFRTGDDTAYAMIPNDDGQSCVPIESTRFRHWLSREVMTRFERLIYGSSLQDAVCMVAAKASFGELHEVHVRLARHGDAIYYDLGRPDGLAVEVTAEGVRTVKSPNVRFVHPKGLLPQPDPDLSGDLEPFFELLNITDSEQKVLLMGTLVAMLYPNIPIGILSVFGPPGSAKSTLCRLIKQLIDPARLAERALAGEIELFLAAETNWVLAFDNLSHISADMSDAICRLVTGGGISRPKKYADKEEVLFEGKRPVILNGVGSFATKSDLLDRIVTINLEPITHRKRRQTIDEEFKKMTPRLLGALLNALSCAMKNLPDMNQFESQCPRLVDFTLVAMAAMPAFGIEPEAFLAAIKRNQKCAGKTALEASPIYTTLLEYLKMKLPNGGSLTRTPTGLKEDLDAQLGGRRRPVNWPKNAAILSGELKHLQALLASEGIAIDFIHSGDRKIGITFTPPLKKKFLKRRRALPSSPSDSPEPAQRVSQA